MHPLWIMLIGVIIVLGGVLVFRIHAFLALVLAAFAVGALTPAENTLRYWIEKNQFKVLSVDGDELVLNAAPKDGLKIGDRLVLVDFAGKQVAGKRGNPFVESSVKVIGFLERNGQQDCIVMSGEKFTDWNADKVVIAPTKLSAARKLATKTVGERVSSAFGGTCGKIGILIAMAAIIGKCLLDSGAADRIVRAALGVLGEKGAPLAFLLSGFLLGVPVFFDTVFYLMMPLGKAMRMRTGRNYVLYILTIVAGASMAHSLVPPTPGPLLVAEELNVDLGLMLLGGCFVGVFSSAAAYFYAHWVNRRTEVPLRASPDLSFEDLKELTGRDTSELPPLWLSLLPILLPVVLIAGYTIIKVMKIQGAFVPLAANLGNKNIALTIAMLVAVGTLVWQKRSKLRDLTASTQAALASGGVIILITSGGGAFGGMLQQTGIAGLVRQLPQGSPQLVIILAFLITTAIRTAQGSATVAMITSVGILGGFADGGLGCHPLYLALAIGCGSKPVAWMNDSGFWVICKISGMTDTEGLRLVTPMSILMGIVGLTVTLILATVLPMT